MADVIHARTWKSAQLSLHSMYFPQMVRAAAAFHKKTYSQAMVDFVAARPAIVDGITLHVGETADSALLTLMTKDAATGQAVDNLILEAVAAYTPPPGTQGTSI